MMTMFRPFGAVERGLFRGMDREFERMFEGSAAPTVHAPADVVESEAGLTLRVDLPGIPESDVRLSVENHVLTLRAARKSPEDPQGTSKLLSERAYGAVSRSFRLPQWVDSAEAKATYAHGVLSITFPRRAESRPRAIEIKVGS